MKKYLIILVSLSVIFGTIAIGIGEYFYRQIFAIETKNESINLQYQLDNNLIDRDLVDSYPFERIRVESRFGYTLDGFHVHNPSNKDRTIIICHGVGGHKYGMFRLIPMFMELGFNVVLFDSRAHGESGGDKYSFGYYEKHDLVSVVDYVRSRFPTTYLGLYGESMGAASILQHAALNEMHDHVDFYIADCGYSDLAAQFVHRLKTDFGLPDLGIIALAGVMTQFHEGYAFSDVRPIDAVRVADAPILFIHGTADSNVPFHMGKAMYEAKPDKKQSFWVDGAEHGDSFATDPEGYRLAAVQFFDTYLKN
jgi:fermentation-respiration switch protein FrsA (DUF1100 family)